MPCSRRGLVGFAIGPAATTFLDQLPAGKVRRQITRKVMSLAKDPRPRGRRKVQGVTWGADHDPVWRIRSGDYRILYVVRAAETVVIDIGNRKDVYG